LDLPDCWRGRLSGWISTASPCLVQNSGSGIDQFGDADQIVGDDIEEEVAGHLGDAPVLGLAQGPCCLPQRSAGDRLCARWALEDHHLPRRARPRRDRRSVRGRSADEPGNLHSVCAPVSRSRIARRRHRDLRQPLKPQGRRGRPAHRRTRGQTAVPAAPRLRRGRLYSPDLNTIDPSTSLRRSSPNSNSSCARRAGERARGYGTGSASSSTSSPPMNAKTTFGMPDMSQYDHKPL
jgi:hypothetical protein